MSDTNELKKVLVFGATGAQDSPVARQLIEKGIAVRGGSRDAEKARELYGEQVEVAPADLSDLDSLRRAFAGVSASAVCRQRRAGNARAARQRAAGGVRNRFAVPGFYDERLDDGQSSARRNGRS